jgi:ribA/ribD-fused uncharacterized protein
LKFQKHSFLHKVNEKMSTALICGGRNFDDVEFIIPRLNAAREECGFDFVITGGAAGADTIGDLWRVESGLDGKVYPADWNRFGKRAGPLRNVQMLEEGKPDFVIAFPGTSGTAHMVDIAAQAGVCVIDFSGRILFRKEDARWGFLSNFYPFEQVDEDGCVWKTNEHFYQSRKTTSEKVRSYVQAAKDPGEAKTRGNAISIRTDWEQVKHEEMLNGLRCKFQPGSWLSDKLLETGDLYLFELAPWERSKGFPWGVDETLKGQNWLGRLLMRRRDELIRL